MYKVFIVEDEWLVLQGLKLTIPWEQMDCTIIGEAGDGQTGLERIMALEPDIVLTDIRMPVMDGIQLAEKVAALLPKVRIVFLTGFDDFAYAQRAVKLGAADFVLKPTNADELIQVMERITRKLDEERRQRSLQEHLEYRMTRGHSLILEKMLYDVMLDVAGSKEMEWFLEEYGAGQSQRINSGEDSAARETTGLEWNDRQEETTAAADRRPYRVLVVQLNKDQRRQDFSDGEVSSLQESWEERASVLTSYPLIRMNEARYALLIDQQVDRTALANALRSLLQPLSGYEPLAAGYGMGISGLVSGTHCIPAAYQQAMRALYQTVFMGRQQVIWFEDVERQPEYTEADLTPVKEFIELVKWGNPASIGAHTTEWYVSLRQYRPDELDARRCFFEFTVVLYSLLLQDTELHGIVLDSGFLLAWTDRVEEPLELALRRLRDMLIEWNRQYTQQTEMHNKSGFEDIEAFIQKHYAEEITLQSIAERYHMSESYFSRLFKKQVGTSFMEYVTQIRIRQAKELLANPRLKIYEASLQVGYQDSRYFSQIFRKYTGETPTEFRKRLGIETVPF